MKLRLMTSYTALLVLGGMAFACGTSDPGPSAAGGTTGTTGGSGPGPTAGTSAGGSTGVGSGGKPAGGATGGGGVTSGGATGAAGTSTSGGTGASGGSTGASGSSSGGTTSGGSGGAGGGGGAGGTGMVPGETKPTVTAPASSKTSKDYFVMGETRLLNNNWGALALGCNASYEIFVNTDKTFGWRWDRNATKCGGDATKPDYPEVEFGIHPFGKNKSLVTSPDYSSTTVLPIMVKDVMTASVEIDSMNINVTGDKNWNMNFEMWFTDQNPVTGSHMGAYAETMNWFGWDSSQYTWPDNGQSQIDAGLTFKLGHKDDAWPPNQSPQWKYRQWRLPSSMRSFSGKIDVKKILDYLTTTEGWPKDTLWISRFEVGTELDDGSAGTLTFKKVTFEVNGQKRSTDFN
jgi:hypothetical protein